ncbi:succinate dehydrogenase assembly factor 3, mitochondrial [Octopus sinensis]|uniref:Succinate dehydrogenase assembly factor 3 n=1 Tax=Octopus sinensis TaxID=2607531 RepID=A0A6P7SJ08_9MOLL|nr:succinate dehydrogenase assembly factor 3, mitochondrial [Octopus sinensis]
MASNSGHVRRVKALYKAILKIHLGLPIHYRAIGDQYVKDEFRRNKTSDTKQTDIFMHEWTKYYVTIAKQLSHKNRTGVIGENLSSDFLDCFSSEQLGQLYELFQETQKPLKEKE